MTTTQKLIAGALLAAAGGVAMVTATSGTDSQITVTPAKPFECPEGLKQCPELEICVFEVPEHCP